MTNRCGLFISLLLLSVVSLGGQTDTVRAGFSRTEWAELTENLDYGPVQQDIERSRSQPPEQDEPRGGNAADLMRVLIIILAAAGLAILLAALLGIGNPRNKKLADPELTIQAIEENLHNAHLDDPIRQAEASEQYNLAIRLHFLRLLRELSLQGYIHWQKDKTNREYLLETARQPWHNRWEELTRIFERVRYGGRSLRGQEYQPLARRFETFHQQFSTQTSLS